VRWSILDPVFPARRAVPSLAIGFFLLTAAFLPLSCGGSSASDTAEPEARGAKDGGSAEDQPVGDGKGGGGWRWKGKRSDCFFRHHNRCFDKLEAACRAAGCEESRCKHDDAAPAVVSCAR